MPHLRRRSGASPLAGLCAAAAVLFVCTLTLVLATPALRAQEPPSPEPAPDSAGQEDPAAEPAQAAADQPPAEAASQTAPPVTSANPADLPPDATAGADQPPANTPPDAVAPPGTDQPPAETPTDAGADQPPAEAAPPPSASGGPEGGSATSSTYFNPSISVIGNFLGVAGDENPVENLPSASLRESEVGLQAIVDPYAKADFFLSFGEEGVEVEEGFITFTSLPADLLVKVGRMRTFFGKVNTLHLHVLPWPDEPLPLQDILGSDEGWIGTGVSAARLIPLPADTFSELTLQVFRGQAAGLFDDSEGGEGSNRKLAWNGHYRIFRDLTEATNLDLGLSYGFGPNGTEPGAQTHLSAVDATFRWKPLQTGLYRSFTARGELFRGEREQPGPDPDAATGWFVSGEYQLARRWFVGARAESSEHLADPGVTDDGLAATLTFWPSEFSQLRGELRRREYADEVTANELLLQLQFAIGAHGAHPF